MLKLAAMVSRVHTHEHKHTPLLSARRRHCVFEHSTTSDEHWTLPPDCLVLREASFEVSHWTAVVTATLASSG